LFQFILTICLTAYSTGLPVEAQSVGLDDLVAEALEANPSLAVLKSRVEIFRAKSVYAGAPPDPILRFDVVNVPTRSFDLGRTPMSGKQVSLQQSLPFPGSLRAREIAADNATSAANSRLGDLKAHVTHLVKDTYYDLAFFNQAIQITSENEALTQSILGRTLARYEVGSGGQHDVLRARVGLTLLGNQLTGFRTSRRLAQIRMNRLLGRSPDSPLALKAGFEVHDAAVSAEHHFHTANENNGVLQELTHTIGQWESLERAEKKRALPSFTFHVTYRQRNAVPGDPVNGEDFLSAGVGLNLPIFRGRKQLARAAEARANADWAEAKLEEERHNVASEIERILAEMELHNSEHNLFTEEILPQTEQALLSVRSAYEADRVDFSALLNAQSTWLDAKLMNFHHAIAHAKLMAELEAVVGLPADHLSGPGHQPVHQGEQK
jgi:cobalt-zinc-cadmium efflux system outer membrane protein